MYNSIYTTDLRRHEMCETVQHRAEPRFTRRQCNSAGARRQPRQGLESEGSVSRTLIRTDGQPTGIFKALGEKPLTAADLAPIPRDASLAAAKRVDIVTALDVLMETIGRSVPPRKVAPLPEK